MAYNPKLLSVVRAFDAGTASRGDLKTALRTAIATDAGLEVLALPFLEERATMTDYRLLMTYLLNDVMKARSANPR